MKVALLEDDEVDAEILARLLSKATGDAFEMTTFTLVADLERGLGAADPDLVFCDMSVPDGRGLEVVERTVEAAGHVPVVVLTSNADPDAPELALKAGAQDYLSKGCFDSETLARSLRYSIARTAADREVQRINRDLLELNHELDQYVGIVAHDLRAPIRTARLLADRLVALSDPGEKLASIGTALDESLDRMELLTSRLLKMATLRDGALELDREPIKSIVSDLQSDMGADIQASGAIIRCADSGSVTADRVLIRELMGNLLQNSINYRRPGEVPRITVSLYEVDGQDEIRVADNGIGIPDRHKERVFGLFERLNPRGEAPGMGFGLAFCRRVAQLHQGSIHIAQPPDAQGTVVCVRLPRRQTARPPSAEATGAVSTTST